MMSTLYKVLTVALLIFSCTDVNATESATSEIVTLDGLQFRGETGEVGKGDHHLDTIIFKEGKFRSTDCESYGFGPAPYKVEKIDNVFHFSSTLVSPELGTLAWKGTIANDKAQGTFRWTRKRWYWTIERDYWFKGKRQDAQP